MKVSFCDICNRLRPISEIFVCESKDERIVSRICAECLADDELSGALSDVDISIEAVEGIEEEEQEDLESLSDADESECHCAGCGKPTYGRGIVVDFPKTLCRDCYPVLEGLDLGQELLSDSRCGVGVET